MGPCSGEAMTEGPAYAQDLSATQTTLQSEDQGSSRTRTFLSPMPQYHLLLVAPYRAMSPLNRMSTLGFEAEGTFFVNQIDI